MLVDWKSGLLKTCNALYKGSAELIMMFLKGFKLHQMTGFTSPDLSDGKGDVHVATFLFYLEM